MFINYRARGLVLGKKDFGESDQLFKIYTKNFGQLEILGKAIRKISSKLRPNIDIFYLADIEFIQAKSYKTLTDAVLLEKFGNIRKDLKRLKIANKISEITYILIKREEADENIWELLVETFEKINNLQFIISDLELIYYYFLFNILSFLGYQPELYNCLVCRKRIPEEKTYFSIKEGGLVCDSCNDKIKSAKKMSPGIIKILRIILKRNLKILAKIKINSDYLKELKLFSKIYLAHILNISN